MQDDRSPRQPNRSTLTQKSDVETFLQRVSCGELSVADALQELRSAPPPTLQIDFDRERRCGFPEVVYGAGKSQEDLTNAAQRVLAHHGRLLVTRLEPSSASALMELIPHAQYHEQARCLTAAETSLELRGRVAILSAGSSDVPVAEEARVTAEASGSFTDAHYDVGVAGVHRLLNIQEDLMQARAIVVVAGMEGALASVVAGLVSVPVIGVPTSVGYGASFGGMAALLTMVNSCANGVSVVNIDNGFGAGTIASQINLLETLPNNQADNGVRR